MSSIQNFYLFFIVRNKCESSFGGGASGRQIWDQSRMFDPGILFGIFPNLIATNFKIWRAKELDIIWFSTVVK